jgi:hypothetical protein
MRNLLHFGLFALALTAVTQADAQERRHGDRHTTVVIAPGGGPRVVQPVRASFDPPHAVYDSRRTIHKPSHTAYDTRRAYFDQREDLEQIVRIAERWEHATANRDRHAQSKVDRRLDAWLEREIRESVREPHNYRHTQRVRVLSDELATLERRDHQGRGYNGHAYKNRGHNGHGYKSRGYYGHSYKSRGYYGGVHRGYSAKKARILNELIELSERQVQRAQASMRHPFRLSFAYR